MRTLSLNVCKDMHLSKLRLGSRYDAELSKRVLADVRHATSVHGVSVIGWQEMETSAHRAALSTINLSGWDSWVPHGAAGAVPISWRHDLWKVVDHDTEQLMDGWPRVSPARFANWVTLENMRTGWRFTRVNTQLISGGWSKGWRPSTAERRTRWEQSMQKLGGLCLELADTTGVPVIGGGDLNRSASADHRFSPFLAAGVVGAPRFRPLTETDPSVAPTHGKRTYDYLWLVEPKRQEGKLANLEHAVERGFFSDHDGVDASVWLPRNGR